MPARISLAMIVKNEAKALPGCLEAARPWVDEIVVVDTGSTDGTQDIARGYGAQVSEWAWRDDFAAARNESLRHVTGDWVLALDADETLTPESGPALREACERAPDDVVAYDIKIVCPHRGNGGFTRLNWFPRLFRNLPGVQWEGVIHEQVVVSLHGRGRIERSQVEVQHAGYMLSDEVMAEKAARNIALLERQLRDEPDHAPAWFQLAESYALGGRVDDAIAAYRRCLGIVLLSRLTLSSSVVALAMTNLGSVLINHRDADEGRRLIKDALSIDPNLVPAHVHLGNDALRQQRWEDAEGHFNTALAILDRPSECPEFEISPWLVYRLRGQARAQANKLTEAMADFERSLALNPGDADTLKLVAMTATRAGDWPRCLDALDQLVIQGENNEALHMHRVMALSSLQRFPEAADACRAALRLKPDSAPALALLGENLSRAGRPAEAVQAYERLASQTGDQPAPWLALAQCREDLGDHAGMLAAYRRAVDAAPDSVDVLFALGSACLRAGLLDAALECLAPAAAREPDRADIRLNHALGLIKRGDLAAGADALAAMLERWPDHPAVRQLHDRVAHLSAAVPEGLAALGGLR
ncbi:MAG: tetratricopeptide repeat protein [Candidatus Rokubacteria bacterium]|nr:tetratricopeptide repeat protein [Candidatus Rokubacteria bacterium]